MTTSADEQEIDNFMANGGHNTSEGPVVESANDARDRKRKAKHDEQASKKAKVVQENRAIWVENLPRDADKDEIEEVFSKFGIIDQGADGNKRIKMYADSEGNFNGTALIVYFKRASIALATTMMDDYHFRLDKQNECKLSVREADPSHKKNTDGQEIVSKLTRKDKKASERNRADLNRKLAEWSDNEEEVAQVYAPKKNKWARVCIIKHAFTFEDLEEDPAAYLDIKDDMREEAEKFGDVTNVTLFDKEPEGILTIRFKEFEAAEKCRDAWHGKSFAFQKLDVRLAEDRPKFKKSNRNEEENSSDEERLNRVAHD